MPKIIVLLSVLMTTAVLLSSCSISEVKYKNNKYLEQPPELEIKEAVQSSDLHKTSEATTESIKKGLDSQVRLETTQANVSTLVISKPFTQSWFIVSVLLKQLDIEVQDKNRDEGVYYVKFDPDIDYSKKRGFWDGMTGLFAEDNYSERVYALKLVESYDLTEVTANYAPESIANSDSESPDKSENDSTALDDAKQDGSERLLQLLYKTLHDGMLDLSKKNRANELD